MHFTISFVYEVHTYTFFTNGFPSAIIAYSRYTRPNIDFVEARDLNLILHLEVFIHFNGNLMAVDTIFCPASIHVLDFEKSKNIN